MLHDFNIIILLVYMLLACESKLLLTFYSDILISELLLLYIFTNYFHLQ